MLISEGVVSWGYSYNFIPTSCSNHNNYEEYDDNVKNDNNDNDDNNNDILVIIIMIRIRIVILKKGYSTTDTNMAL